MHPYLAQPELLEYCKNKGILVAAYTPTGGFGITIDGARPRLTIFTLGYQDVLTNPTIVELAGKYGVAPVQVVLAWHIARGVVAVPKSSNKERQKQNITVSVSVYW